MDGPKCEQKAESSSPSTFVGALDRLPQLMDKDKVLQMIDVQVDTLDRLECTNKSLINCSNMAQSKLVATTKLYKRTAKQLSESKKDLDVCYKKILELKTKLKAERPDLFKASSPEIGKSSDHTDNQEH